jgi:endonuclease-8
VPVGAPHRYVYRRHGEPCLVCGTRVRTREVEGRNLYWCSGCQRRAGRRRMATASVASVA